MQFTKMHGAGNDYVYIDAREQEHDWQALSVAMSDRHLGVGSDGLILALPSEKADMRMRDVQRGRLRGRDVRQRDTLPREFRVRQRDCAGGQVAGARGDYGGRAGCYAAARRRQAMVGARVLMGEPRLNPRDVPVAIDGIDVVIDQPLQVAGREFRMTCVSMGNPHAVVFMDEPVDDFPLTEIGPMVEHHPLFPARVNFEIANVLDGGKVIKTRVWERGSGITMACGTGACAVQVAARLNGLAGDRATIALPGGDLTVEWRGEGEVVMEGPVATVFDGEWLG